MIKIVERPTKILKGWAIDLVVTNMKIYNKSSLLRYAKSKSISNPANTFIVSYKEVGDPVMLIPNGFVTIRIFEDVLYVYEIHVEPNSQNKGIGSQLLEFIKKRFREAVDILILYVHKINTKAVKFYEANGFKINKKAKCDIKYYEMVFRYGK